MDHHEKVTQLIYAAIGEVNEMRSPDEALGQTPDAVIIGAAAKMDSLAFVTFVAAVEESVQRSFGRAVSLIDFMLVSDNPHWTVATLASSIAERVNGNGHRPQHAPIAARLSTGVSS